MPVINYCLSAPHSLSIDYSAKIDIFLLPTDTALSFVNRGYWRELIRGFPFFGPGMLAKQAPRRLLWHQFLSHGQPPQCPASLVQAPTTHAASPASS